MEEGWRAENQWHSNTETQIEDVSAEGTGHQDVLVSWKSRKVSRSRGYDQDSSHKSTERSPLKELKRGVEG